MLAAKLSHRYHCLSVYLLVAVEFARQCSAQYQWTEFVNTVTGDFDFLCPDDLAVTGVASTFSATDFDRRWEYRCSSGGGLANVTSECTLQDEINSFQSDIDYTCPENGYIAGFQSEHSSTEYDRLWRPYCCTRPYASLVDCQTPSSTWENKLEELLNWTASDDRVLAGLESFYSSFDRDRRWRFKQCKIEVNCGDPGVPDNAVREGSSFLFEDVVNFTCVNGYYQSSGPEDGLRKCEETGLWSDSQPVCSLCTDIEFCADIRCTNTTDQLCHECEGDHGIAVGETAYDNLGTSCEPLCSWLEGFCYPGECSAGISSCNCSSDFDGPDCLDITTQPDLVSCLVSVSDGSAVKPYTCTPNSTEPIYINFLPTQLSANWMGTFVGPMPAPDKPAYVAKYGVGIVESNVVANVYRATSYPSSSVSATKHSCVPAMSLFTPDKPSSMIKCNAMGTNLSNHTFLHADWFEIQVYVNNGGILNITNLDENDTTSYYYQGSPITGIALYVIDVQPPVHCSMNSSCLSNQDILDYSRSLSSLSITWGGWSDIPSGVTDYRVEIAELIYNEAEEILSESVILESDSNQIHTGTTSIYSATFILSSEGPYSIFLAVTDTAGNKQYARRVIVYDDTSEPKIDETRPLVVVGGAKEGEAYWHNSTTDPIVVSGLGHFYNTNLKTSNWLAPVANHTSPILAYFDDPGRDGIPNAQGVTRLSYAIVVDDSAGTSDTSVMEPVSFPYETDNLAIDNIPVNFTAADGYSVTIWFEAIDYQFNKITDSLLVHIDSTPPELSGLGLVYNGVGGLVLYGRPSLLDLNVVFQASDPHSGLWSIEWIIYQAGLDDLVGSGAVPVTNIAKEVCVPNDDCICDTLNHCHMKNHNVPLASTDFPTGDDAQHDTDYFITITAYNYARLESSITRQITVDLTPPVPGYVLEGPVQGSDLDYQTNLAIAIHWTGFFDRETAVLFYQYIIGTECASADLFQHPKLGTSLANTTTDIFVEWIAPSVGTYYTTVVAYNGALEPSNPVCSDGITIDNQPPSFEGVYIQGGRVKQGLIRCEEEGGVWLVHSNRELSQVNESTDDCINRSTAVSRSEIMAFPVRNNGSSVSSIPSSLCVDYEPFTPVTYTAVDAVLNITWQATDNVLVRNYYLGLASAWNKTVSPDLLPFQSTAGHPHFSTPVAFGTEFFVVVKAIDVAMQETSVLVGPVIVDISPPLINGSLSFDSDTVGTVVIVSWEEDTFSDDDDWFPLIVEYAVGTIEYGTDLLAFVSIPTPSTSLCPSGRCVIINKEEIGFVRGSVYYFTIKVTNTAGLSSFVTTEPYLEPFTLLTELSVFEYSDSTDPGMSKLGFKPLEVDIDVVLDSVISVGWVGFSLDYLNVTFEVALGSEPGWADVTGYVYVNRNNSHAFTTHNLNLDNYYYTTVRATNVYSTVFATSDGFVAFPHAESLLDKAFVLDGFVNGHESDYQLSTTETALRWYFPPSLALSASHYEWTLFKVNDNNLDNLTEVVQIANGGMEPWAVASTPQLETKSLYVAAVYLCFKQKCIGPVFSDGFQVATSPSTFTLLSANYAPLTTAADGLSISGTLNITWASSFDPQRDHYEWAIGTGLAADELITKWTKVSSSTNQVYLLLEQSLSLYESYYVTVRDVNTASLSKMAIASLNIVYLGDSQQFVLDIEVLETVNITSISWEDVEYHTIDSDDIDYTASLSSLSATWPRLRYREYQYSVSTERSFLPCGHTDTLACGTTMGDSVTITSLVLEQGKKYFICISADAENYIGITLPVKSISTCSDGITVLHSPPVGGCVQIMPAVDINAMPELASGDYESGDTLPFLDSQPRVCVNQSGYQASTTSLCLAWDEFKNAEGVQDIPHVSQVAFYEYAIGTSPGAQDVSPFTAVGLVKEVVLNNLKLKAGFTYYASIRATDHVGQSSIAGSQGLTVDVSSPVIVRPSLGVAYAATAKTQLLPQWELINDPESGVLLVFWALGSETGLSDLVDWTEVAVTETSVALPAKLNISDGQSISLTLMATNNAGLTAVVSSQLILFDASLPVAGRVFDGPRPVLGFWDLDYTANHTHFLAHWEPFLDPHSVVTEYHWGVGSCLGCTDVMPFVNVGLYTDADVKLSLAHGQWYYVSVRGCSLFSGCSVGHSNGIRVDVTPPITSQLSHGLPSAPLAQFQASRNTITCHWTGFHDDESAISHYVVYAGVSPEDDSFIQPTSIPATESFFLSRSPFIATNILPNNRTLYVTLVAHNHAGLSTSITSGGTFVTDTSPLATEPTAIDVNWAGSLVSGTQYSSTAVRLSWGFSVSYSSIRMVTYHLLPEEGTVLPTLPQTFLPLDYTTVVDVGFFDGSRYTAVAIGCSQAGLCTQEESTQVLVDSSPPLDGYFAVKTDTVADLPWAIADGMSWLNDAGSLAAMLNITFTGFNDPHSGISEYWASVGSEFANKDLYDSSSSLAIVEHPHADVLLAPVYLTRMLVPFEIVYVSLWAVNGAGLRSHLVKGSFIVIQSSNVTKSGSLKMLRSAQCPPESCLGHCTCSRRGQLCDTLANASLCVKLASNDTFTENMKVSISSITPQLVTPVAVNYTAVTDKLIAEIEYEEDTIQWVEWSVGEKGLAPGSGLIHTDLDPVWFPLGTGNTAVFIVSPEFPVKQGLAYVFYARAWYNFTHYAIFESSCITIDSYSPQVREGHRTRETDGLTDVEVDHTSSDSEISVNWSGVFLKTLSGLYAEYEVGVGETPGSDELLQFTPLGNISSTILTGIKLVDNHQYFTTIRSTNSLGMSSWSISDGFLVDLTPPVAGVVFDGPDDVDISAQLDSESAFVRQFGFHDPQSYIHHYQLAITPYPTPSDNTSFFDVGINLRPSLDSLDLVAGETYYSHVAAVNIAGTRTVVSSNGFTVDTSPPYSTECFPLDILDNRSFEDDTTSPECEDSSEVYSVTGWQTDGQTWLLSKDKIMPTHGCYALQLSGQLSQSFPTNIGQRYVLNFDIQGISTFASIIQFHVIVPGLELVPSCRIFPVKIDNNGQVPWYHYEILFTAVAKVSSIHILDVWDDIVIDNVQVFKCTPNVAIEHIQLPDFVPPVSKLLFHWQFQDNDTDLIYKWAVGTVRGGEQVQEYTLASTSSWGLLESTNFVHNSTLYLSVVATNGAGIDRLVHSNPIRVDATAPELLADVREGDSKEDQDYQSSAVLHVDWTGLTDKESGIKQCAWAIGTFTGGADVQPFKITEDSEGTTGDLSTLITHGTTLYSTITCINQVGFSSTAYSDGITILKQSPVSDFAMLSIESPMETLLYKTMYGYVPSNSILIRWSGFRDTSFGPMKYQLRLIEMGVSLGMEDGWIDVGFVKQVTITNVTAAINKKHSAEVRAYIVPELTSDIISQDFVISPSPPKTTGTPVVTWDTSQVTVNWDGVLTAEAPLYYIVSLGSQVGSSSIRRWAVVMETMDPLIVISDHPLEQTTDYFLSLTGVTYSGLSLSVNYIITGTVAMPLS